RRVQPSFSLRKCTTRRWRSWARIWATTFAPDTSGRPIFGSSVPPTRRTSCKVTSLPTSPAIFSIRSTSPSAIRYCFPPVRITAYIALPLSLVGPFRGSRSANIEAAGPGGASENTNHLREFRGRVKASIASRNREPATGVCSRQQPPWAERKATKEEYREGFDQQIGSDSPARLRRSGAGGRVHSNRATRSGRPAQGREAGLPEGAAGAPGRGERFQASSSGIGASAEGPPNVPRRGSRCATGPPQSPGRVPRGRCGRRPEGHGQGVRRDEGERTAEGEGERGGC